MSRIKDFRMCSYWKTNNHTLGVVTLCPSTHLTHFNTHSLIHTTNSWTLIQSPNALLYTDVNNEHHK